MSQSPGKQLGYGSTTCSIFKPSVSDLTDCEVHIIKCDHSGQTANKIHFYST